MAHQIQGGLNFVEHSGHVPPVNINKKRSNEHGSTNCLVNKLWCPTILAGIVLL